MSGEQPWKVDERTLSKKYRTDVNRLIRAWKKGLNDQEITFRTGVKPSTLYLIKQDIELAHRRHRLAQEKTGTGSGSGAWPVPDFFQPQLVVIVIGIVPGQNNDPGLTFRADIAALNQEAPVVHLPQPPAKDAGR